MSYAEKLKDPRWQKKRLQIMERDGFACRDCKRADKTLHVHHCAYVGRDPWLAPDSVLLTLCPDCHESRQENENDAHLMLGQIMAKLPSSADEVDLVDFIDGLSRGVGMADPSVFSMAEVTAVDYELARSRLELEKSRSLKVEAMT